MDPRVIQLANEYRQKHAACANQTATDVQRLYTHYSLQGETALLDAIGASAAVYGLLTGPEALTPEMREAFSLAYPSVELNSLFGRSVDELDGYINGWRGKYFEVLVSERLNAGEVVGSIYLADGQTAVLAESPVQRGWDLAIENADGTIAAELQLKATKSLGYIKAALERYPDIQVVATDEVAVLSEEILSSGISNDALTQELLAPMADLAQVTVDEVVSGFLPLLPIVILAVSEGRYVIAGRKSLHEALSDGAERALKTSAAIGVGGIVALLDGGLLSLPAAMFTRVGIDRVQISTRIARDLDREISLLLQVARQISGERIPVLPETGT
jgi:hypothetical protein